MNQYNTQQSVQHAYMADRVGPYNFPAHSDGRDDQGSLSGSDDAATPGSYLDQQKLDLEVEEDPNASLTSQTLNADGTPKRPMNAFMIFARRRRPQVSAQHQAMRTGEISKLLSREWNAMDLSDKQFYLDQAKLLKDNFNNKYPDYVYRRRPNHTRRKRRADSGADRVSEQSLAIDAGDDATNSMDYGENTFDSEEPFADDGASEFRYPSQPRDSYGGVNGFDDQLLCHERSRGDRSSDLSDQAIAPTDAHLSYLTSSHARSSSDSPPRSSHPINVVGSVHLHHRYAHPHRSHTPSSAAYATDQRLVLGWDQVNSQVNRIDKIDPGRDFSQGWSNGNHDQDFSPPDSKVHLYNPQNTEASWPMSSGVPVDSRMSTSHHRGHFPAPNAPFYPNESGIEGGYNAMPPPSSLDDASDNYGASLHAQSDSIREQHMTGYDHHNYSSIPSISSAPYSANTHPDMHFYRQESHLSHQSSPLPSIQSVPSISNAPALQSSFIPPSETYSSSQTRYWTPNNMNR